MILSTEFKFTLPKGLIDVNSSINRQGKMRLATGKDEIFVDKDYRVRQNSDYRMLVMLSRVITQLGNLTSVFPDLLEQLFLTDWIYLQELFTEINQPYLEVSPLGEL